MVSKFLSSLWGRAKGERQKKEEKNSAKGESQRSRQRPQSEYIPRTETGCGYSASPSSSAPSCSSRLSLTPPLSSACLRTPPLSRSLASTDSGNESASFGHSPSEKLSKCSESASGDPYELPMKSALAFTWDVQFVGSFPISNTQPELVSSRLERFAPSAPRQRIQLSVSLLGVRVSQQENVLMSHSLRRVCSVVARAQSLQVAYIAMEPAGQTYRRQCHVFETTEPYQVEEIESVLGNAFQAALLRSSQRRDGRVFEPRRLGDTKEHRQTVASTPILEMPLGERQRVSSTAFLSRLLGKGKEAVLEDAKAKRKRRPVSAVFSSAIHRLSSTTNMGASKRMSTAELARRDPSASRKGGPQEPPPKQTPPVKATPPLAEQEDTSSTGSSSTSSSTSYASSTTNRNSTVIQKDRELVYDVNLGESVYPVDEVLEAQLKQVAYFCNLPTRESLLRNLLAQPEGAFVLRYSESKARFLALSVRVSHDHNRRGVSHYLIVRNEKGFRIRTNGASTKHFPSIQMLVTHHSVMQEQLPCRLLFVQWSPSDWLDQKKVQMESKEPREGGEGRRIEHLDHERVYRGSKVFPIECDENRNTCFYDDAVPSKTVRDSEPAPLWSTSTPKRRSRQFGVDPRRHSRFVELEQF